MAINSGPIGGFAINNSAGVSDLVWPILSVDVELAEGTVEAGVELLASEILFLNDVQVLHLPGSFYVEFLSPQLDIEGELILPYAEVEVNITEAQLALVDVELLPGSLAISYDAPLTEVESEAIPASLEVGVSLQLPDPLEVEIEALDDNARVSYAEAALSYTIQQVITGDSGLIRLWVTSDIYEYGTFSITLEQQIGDYGSISQTIENEIYETGQVQATLEQQIYDAADFDTPASGDCTKWKAIVTLGGVNVSDRINGVIRVDAEESTQRTAEFTLRPKDNAEKNLVNISLGSWIHQPVTIDYATLNDDFSIRSQIRIFTGKVDEPVYDPGTRLVTFNCIDNMLVELENMPRSVIDAQTPGARWTDQLFDVDADGYQYALDRMTTIPYALDKDKVGVYSWTPWAAKVSPDFTFVTSGIIDQSLSVELQPGRELVNEIDIDFKYKFDRKRQRKAKFDWAFPSTFCEYLGVGLTGSWTLPNVSMIKDAAEGTGWCLERLYIEKLPRSQWVNCGVNLVAWIISDALRDSLAFKARGILVKRFLQSISESYPLQVLAPTSIAAFGTQKDDISQRIVAKVDLSDWENANECCEVQVNQVSVGGGGPDNWETWEDVDTSPEVETGTDRVGMEYAMETLLAQAQNQILDTHRQNRVSFDVPIQPMLERYHTVEIDTDTVDARGKVFQILHTLDTTAGSAVTSVVLAISKNGTGVTTPTALTAPTKPDTTERLATLSAVQRIFDTETRYGGIAFETNATRVQLNTVSIPDPSASTTGAGGTSFGDPEPIGGADPESECAGVSPDQWIGYVGNKVPADPGSISYSERFVLVAEEIEEVDREEEEAEAGQAYNVEIPDDLLALAA